MTTQSFTRQSSYRRRLLPGLTLLWMLTLVLGLIQPAQAATPGKVIGWGEDTFGQLNIPAGLNNVVAVTGGYKHSLALKGDGIVVAWGDNFYGQLNIPAGLSDVVAVAGGRDHSLALKGDGTVVAWGRNNDGQINIPAGLSDVVAIGAGDYHSLAVKGDGTVVAWGENFFGQLNIPSGLSDVVAVTGGFGHSLAVKGDGTVVAWGENFFGELNIPAGLDNVVAIAAGEVHSLALKGDGTVVAWGANYNGQLNIPAGLDNVVAIAVGYADNIALKADGTVVHWGRNLDGAFNVPVGLKGVIGVGMGNDFILAILETTPPVVTVTGVSAGAVYTVGSVPAAGCNTTDAFAGVATPATLSVTGGNPDGTGSFTATCSGATDNAGNTANPVSVTYTVNPPPDSTAPVITANVAGTAGSNGWYVSDVTVSWTVVDNESTISSQSDCDPVTVNSDTAGVTFTCTATSAGGSSSQSVMIKRDATAPTLSAAASSAPNANGWYNSDVTVQFTCNDNLSEVVNCPADEVLSSEGSVVNSTAQTITDGAGNSSAASNVVTVKIDKTAPVVSVTGVSNGANYTLGSVPAAGCSTTDALSGVATQANLSVTGGNADGTGSFTATCNGATDNAGNSGSVSVTYNVAYNWTGFFQPVDNLPVVNTVNAGQAIPVKFSLGGDFGLNIFASGYPKVQSCSSGGSGGGSDEIEETVTAGGSTLQYNATTQTYTYVWKTDKAWAGTCRQLIVRLIDGTDHIALFQFNGKARSADAEGEVEVVQQVFLPLVNR